MKYGILTIVKIPNIGAVFQGYALCMKMRSLGIECEIIDYECVNINQREKAYHALKNPIKNVAKKMFVWPATRRRILDCENFASELYSTTRYNKKNINEANARYDGFVSGSDMIWNLNVTGHDYTFFLDFVDDAKNKFSYASSIGEQWKQEDIQNVGMKLNRYSKISVRESDTCKLIQNQLRLPCTTVCDPTMLLDKTEWDKLVVSINDKNYVLVYFPYKEILEKAKKYAKKNHKKLVVLGETFPWKAYQHVQYKSPQEWISYIRNADAVFTDSYHGFLFSLYFEKKVWTNNKGNRFKSLLEELELSKCWIENDPNFINIIDYERCRQLIKNKREYSEQYIIEAVKRAGDAECI